MKQSIRNVIPAIVLLFLGGLLHHARRILRIVPSRLPLDDLPAAAADFMTGVEINEMTAKLLTTLRDQKVPASGS